MAQYRLSGTFVNGGGGGGGGGGNGGIGNDVASGYNQQLQHAVSIGIHSGASHKHQQQARHHNYRRLKAWHRKISITALTIFLVIAFVSSVVAFVFLSSQHREIDSHHSQESEVGNDANFLANVTRTPKSEVLKFGHGRDSRYWDRDNRRRDKEYSEKDLEKARVDSIDKDHVPAVEGENSETLSVTESHKDTHHGMSGLYNEAGRDELKRYEAEYEASLKRIEKPNNDNLHSNQLSNGVDVKNLNEIVDVDGEYDDVIDAQDVQSDEYIEVGHDNKLHSNILRSRGTDGEESSTGTIRRNVEADKSFTFSNAQSGKTPVSKRRAGSRKKPTRHRFGPCEMKILNSSAMLVEPIESRKFARFSLQYTDMEEKPNENESWEPRFAGHQSLNEREESYIARDQKINCGFVKGPKGSPSTGFDLAEDDAKYISSCHIAVVSCIFGNSDRLRLPATKTISKLSRKNVCFVMFVDEQTLQTLSSEGQMVDRMGFIDLWKMVVVKNLPYTDMRRVGKIPKFLSHRLFPSARYSIWLDSKLRIQLDPLLILEYFLWRKNFEYAISNHYDRHCVWEEVAQNKKLNKYNHTVIDEQFAFYQADGLKRFNASDPKKFLPSNVPEGSLIIRAHTPMSNLFSCLWFNEVDRFTSRDQLSFAYTYYKLRSTNPKKRFYLNMFKDCERRKIAKLFHHRSQEKKSMLQHDSE